MTLLLWHLVPWPISLSVDYTDNSKIAWAHCSSISKLRGICLVLKRSVPSYASHFAGAFTTLEHHRAFSTCVDPACVGMLLGSHGLKHNLRALPAPWIHSGHLALVTCWRRSGGSLISLARWSRQSLLMPFALDRAWCHQHQSSASSSFELAR